LSAWKIPGECIKMDRDHIVPLSDPALAVLDRMRDGSQSELIFANPDGTQYSENAMLAVLDRLGYLDQPRQRPTDDLLCGRSQSRQAFAAEVHRGRRGGRIYRLLHRQGRAEGYRDGLMDGARVTLDVGKFAGKECAQNLALRRD
jgi:hypothetical protein